LEGTEPVSFEDFYRARAPDLYRYATTVAARGTAEDACQEAWLRMWRAWSSAQPSCLDAWARQVVRNCCLDGRRRRSATGDRLVASGDVDGAPEEVALRHADAAAIAGHFDRLPPAMREVLWLREVIDLSYREMSRALGIPMGTVMSRLHSARRKLARKLPR
jgi:RNA polymerase sigma-70 factor (ECF subfamily)